MKKHRILYAILAVIMALLLILSLLSMILTPGPAKALSQSDIDALLAQQDDLKRQSDALQAQIDKYNNNKSDLMAQKALLDQQVATTQSRIDNCDSLISELTAKIAVQQKVYDDAYNKEQEQLKLFTQQLRASEELGNVSYLSILFGANSFSDLLGRIDFMSQVYSLEQNTVNNLRAAKAAADAAKKTLETDKSAAEATKTELEQLKAKLNSDLDEAHGLIRQVEQTINDENSKYKEMMAEEEALAERILEMTKALDEQNRGSQPGSNGNYIWPSDCRLITSPFGDDYLNGSWRKHNGVDIGASYGTSIYAADGGQVVASTYSSSYGNYVMISHGAGRYTLYAHMLKRLVSEGDSVTQGQVIGKCDSTGYSFGSHVHFEIIENGSYVNPLNYLGGYTVGY